jgi:integrase
MGTARKLTVKAIEAAKGRDKRYMLPDGAGLYVAVYPDHRKSFYLRYTQGGKDRWMLLADAGRDTFPALSLERARQLAADAQASLKAGTDPLDAKQAKLLEAKVRQAERIRDAQEKLARLTVADVFKQWMVLELSKRKDRGVETQRGFDKDVLPKIGAMPAESVKKAHIMVILDAVLTRGSPRMAKRFLSELRQMFGFALDRDFVAADPTARIKKDRIGGKAVIRDRHLTEEEIRALATQIPAARLLKTTETALWIMLATCCRVGEISQARWQDIDLEQGVWVIPAAHAKNGRRFEISLSDFAKQQFRQLQEMKAHDVWILPNRAGTSHIDIKTVSRQVHDRQRQVALAHHSSKTLTLMLAGGPWTPHDLRRTGATLMGNLGVPPYVIERCLNHVEPNRLVRTYQHQKLIAEQADAWRLLGERLHLLTTPTENVVLLPSRAA